VPAGHDQFSDHTIRPFLEAYCAELRVPVDKVASLARASSGGEFNMTALAVRGSRFQNGVSRIHGDVSAEILSHLWPQIESEDNPVIHVTNGVHVQTFLAQDWHELFDRFLGPGWSQRLTDRSCWDGIHSVPDQLFWSVRQSLKAQMLHLVRHRIAEQHFRNQGSEAHLDRMLKLADPANPNILTFGFARRFATYKRATLLFENLDWLREIVSDAQRPVLFIFAGKAHPADHPGQDVLRRVSEVARMPEFEGRILLVEGYDLRLARRLVSGVDVWLNNPIYPMEASGTSGMKAAINGAPNCSVLDGWWCEGYAGDNGWSFGSPDAGATDDDDAAALYEVLEREVVPLYYTRDAHGIPTGWVERMRAAIATSLHDFSADRMVSQYLEEVYLRDGNGVVTSTTVT
jgi:glycogen phosphorylase